ncbi:MAG: hypothetical protein V5A28_02660 [Haloarculaceae archaeon]
MTGYELVRRPGRRSVAVSGVAGSFVVAAGVAGGPLPTAVALAGVACLLAGVWLGSHRIVDAGALVAFGGVVGAALLEAGPLAVLFGTVAAVVAWDTGTNAVTLSEQVGRGADTSRVEVLHALYGAAVGVAGGVLGFVLFSVGPTRQPVTTLFVLLLAAAVLVVALNR